MCSTSTSLNLASFGAPTTGRGRAFSATELPHIFIASARIKAPSASCGFSQLCRWPVLESAGVVISVSGGRRGHCQRAPPPAAPGIEAWSKTRATCSLDVPGRPWTHQLAVQERCGSAMTTLGLGEHRLAARPARSSPTCRCKDPGSVVRCPGTGTTPCTMDTDYRMCQKNRVLDRLSRREVCGICTALNYLPGCYGRRWPEPGSFLSPFSLPLGRSWSWRELLSTSHSADDNPRKAPPCSLVAVQS